MKAEEAVAVLEVLRVKKVRESTGSSSSSGSSESTGSSSSSSSSGSSESTGSSSSSGSSESKESTGGTSASGSTTNEAAAGAAKGGSSQSTFDKYFDVEGDSPYRANGAQEFDAIGSSVITPNGNGIRNEVKVKEEERVGMTQASESFSATITPDLSPGTQTIVSQWHGEDEGGLVKLYLDDQSGENMDTGTKGVGVDNGVPSDGVFDVYAIYTDEDGENQRVNFGTIEQGESMDVDITNDRGNFSATVNGESGDFKVADDDEVYFKYGAYLQTKDPVTGERAKPSEGGLEILERNNVTDAKVTFENVNFEREVHA